MVGRPLAVLVPVSCLALLAAPDLGAQCATPERAHFQATDTGAGNLYGYSLDVEGDRLVVGAPRNDFMGANSGAVYVYQRSAAGVAEVQKLIAASSIAHDRFGYSVDVCGELLIVGARRARELGRESGAAYIFRWQGGSYVEEARLLASDGAEDDEFGFTVAIRGDLALVGAPFKDATRDKEGAAYVFRRQVDGQWTEEQKLVSTDATPGPDQFGRHVAVSDHGLLVGADLDNGPGFDSGSVFCFVHDGQAWSLAQKIEPADGSTGDRFGASFDVEGERLVVGAPGVDDDGTDAGAIFVYEHDGQGWQRQVKLGAGAAGRELGRSVALAGDTLVAGAPVADRAGAASGEAQVFRRQAAGWMRDRVLIARGAQAGDEFGFSVATDGASAYVGAIFSDHGPGGDAGLVHEHSLPALALGASPLDSASGQALRIDGCTPEGAGPCLLIALAVDGAVVDQRLAWLQFDGQGRCELNATVPPGLSGLSMDLLLVGAGGGGVAPSNVLRLEFL